MVDIEQQIPMAIMNKENIIPNARTLSMMKVDTTPRDWDDLDAEDADDPLMVSEYVVEIFDYMRQLEVILILRLLIMCRGTLCPSLITCRLKRS